jgi:peptidoglycan/xylan/chitin deacetylase (PgdA/CDA1 family)
VFGQIKELSVEVCTWRNDKLGAISISFDDASYTQYEYAYPILEKFNFKASFSLVGEWTKDKPSYSSEPGIFKIKKMGWGEIKELNSKGHEICAHGYRHIKYSKESSKDTLIYQMKKIKDLIDSKISNKCTTLHYPYSSTSDSITTSAKQAGFLFARTGAESINSAIPDNMYLLGSKAIWSEDYPTINDFKSYINEAKGKWLILMYHHLFTNDSKEIGLLKDHKIQNTYSLLPSSFEKQMQLISNSNYWVAPIATIGKYIEERNHTKIKIRKIFDQLYIETSTDLDTSIYNERITIKIKSPWGKVKIYQECEVFKYDVKDSFIQLDILPGGITSDLQRIL